MTPYVTGLLYSRQKVEKYYDDTGCLKEYTLFFNIFEAQGSEDQ